MTTPTSFAVTWDYRCPFARNAHEHLLDGLADGAEWDITYLPFFLNQSHVAEGGTPAWEDPHHTPHLLPLEAGIVVRDRFPEHFPEVHRSLFAARHDEGGDLRERDVVRKALERVGAPVDDILAQVDDGWPRAVARTEHEQYVNSHEVFGVPTFIIGDDAVFARLMTRPEGNGAVARKTIDQVLELLVDHPDLNEFKHTRIAR